MTAAVYDAHADWYEDYVTGAAAEHMGRVRELLADLLGPGDGPCLDVCCGTGVPAGVLHRLGWRPLGVDVSTGQLRHAAGRLPVVAADAAALPVRSGSVAAAVVVHGHTDVADYPAVLREVARCLRPGGRFVHVGIHPCFCGAFADWGQPEKIILTRGYHDTARTFESWSSDGVRARVGARHLPLADLVNAVLAAGLRLVEVRESGARLAPDLLGLTAIAA